MADPAYNAGDEEQVGDLRRRQKFEVTAEQRDVLELLASPAGRRVLWRILSECAPMARSYTPGAEREEFFVNEGKRDIGHFIIAMLDEADPYAYIQLQRENVDDA